MNLHSLKEFLSECASAYYSGLESIISDDQYDKLSDIVKYSEVGYKSDGNKSKHYFPMYSLNKYFVGEGELPYMFKGANIIKCPKLDGAAISILYTRDVLNQMLTRGDGEYGMDITDKAGYIHNIPSSVEGVAVMQVSGEVVVDKDVPNARNYVAGALNLNDVGDFFSREPMVFPTLLSLLLLTHIYKICDG